MIVLSRRVKTVRPLAPWLFVLLGAAGAGPTAEAPAPTTQPGGANQAALVDRLDRILAARDLSRSLVGVHVVDLADGRVLYSRQADEPLIPASNMKLVTTAAALDLLGPQWTFQTHLALRGPDLVVIGGGDPTLSARLAEGDPTLVLDRWIAELRRRGITHIAGDLVLDDGYFDDQWRHPEWPRNQYHAWYCAPVGALSFNDNCIDVSVEPGPAVNGPAVLKTVPAVAAAEIDNALVTGLAGQPTKWTLRRVPGQARIVAQGVVTGPDSSEITVDEPTVWFGRVFADALQRNGIELSGQVRREPGARRDAQVRLLLTHQTPLVTALVVANKRSQGFYSEQVFKALGAELSRPAAPGSWATGRVQVERFLTRIGIPEGTYVVDDGSGLSKKNRFSAAQFTKLLGYMFGHAHSRTFIGSLAVAGEDGTLKNRLRRSEARGRVYAKSGYVAGVRALSGYVYTRAGRWVAFSILANRVGSYGKVAADQICEVLSDYGLP